MTQGGTERRDIGSRLENWARWSTANERRPASSPTATFCDRLRREAEGDTSREPDDRRRVDEADALLLERGMRYLETKHRMLLWWCYIRQARPEIICRKMAIPSRPSTEFVRVFQEAQAAIEASAVPGKLSKS